MKMKWKTLNNQKDCGVFLMCHMDTYTGEPVGKWDPGFVTEVAKGKITQKKQLHKLRMKYCAKILLHPMNLYRVKMSAVAEEYRGISSKDGIKMVNEVIQSLPIDDSVW